MELLKYSKLMLIKVCRCTIGKLLTEDLLNMKKYAIESCIIRIRKNFILFWLDL